LSSWNIKGKDKVATTSTHTTKMYQECAAKAQHIIEISWMESE